MSNFTFYFQELIGGNKYREVIEAENWRIARNLFFEKHKNTPHKIDAIWDAENNIRYV